MTFVHPHKYLLNYANSINGTSDLHLGLHRTAGTGLIILSVQARKRWLRWLGI